MSAALQNIKISRLTFHNISWSSRASQKASPLECYADEGDPYWRRYELGRVNVATVNTCTHYYFVGSIPHFESISIK